MNSTPVDLLAARNFYISEARNPTRDWTNLCQMLARLSYGIPALYGSAYAQWLGADSKHATTDLNVAPTGSFLCTKGSNPAGHIYYAAPEFANGATAGWSNDLVKTGDVDKVRRNAPMTHWGHHPLGYILEINEHVLDLTHGAPPKPKQNKRYKAVDLAIHKMGIARDRAKAAHDTHDVQLLNKEISDLKALYGKIRRA